MKMPRPKEKENENGEKEVVEVSPAKDKVKIKKRPESLVIFIRSGQNIRMSAVMRTTKSFTAKYFWIIKSRCSGFI